MRSVVAAVAISIAMLIGVARADDMAVLLAETPQSCAAQVQTKDDDLDVTAKFDTVNCFKQSKGFLQLWSIDNFLRAWIDKRTGATTFQVYESVIYDDDGWRFYETANFATPAGPQTTPVTSISRDVISCSGMGCLYDEDFGFDVDESLLRAEAATYAPSTFNSWQFKFSAKNGSELRDGIMPAEIAALLSVIDAYRAAHPQMHPAPPPPPPVAAIDTPKSVPANRKKHSPHH